MSDMMVRRRRSDTLLISSATRLNGSSGDCATSAQLCAVAYPICQYCYVCLHSYHALTSVICLGHDAGSTCTCRVLHSDAWHGTHLDVAWPSRAAVQQCMMLLAEWLREPAVGHQPPRVLWLAGCRSSLRPA